METAKSQALSLIRRAARAYSAGPALQNARAVCDRFATEGLSSTVCYWNVSFDPPERVASCYTDILGLIPDLHTDCYLSVKAPAIQFNPDLLKNILDYARFPWNDRPFRCYGTGDG